MNTLIFDGSIKDILIYNKALTQAQILYLYQSAYYSNTVIPPNPIVFLPLSNDYTDVISSTRITVTDASSACSFTSGGLTVTGSNYINLLVQQINCPLNFTLSFWFKM